MVSHSTYPFSYAVHSTIILIFTHSFLLFSSNCPLMFILNWLRTILILLTCFKLSLCSYEMVVHVSFTQHLHVVIIDYIFQNLMESTLCSIGIDKHGQMCQRIILVFQSKMLAKHYQLYN